jgi:Ser/Thr protein kinase RdoA (MazF antagonist)
VWHDHVLFTGDEVTGLIDPSACRSESVAADLARLLGSLVGDDSGEWDFALDAYRQSADLTLDERALIPVLDRSGVLLSGLTWLARCYLHSPPLEPNERLLKRLCVILARLEHLAHRV